MQWYEIIYDGAFLISNTSCVFTELSFPIQKYHIKYCSMSIFQKKRCKKWMQEKGMLVGNSFTPLRIVKYIGMYSLMRKKTDKSMSWTFYDPLWSFFGQLH